MTGIFEQALSACDGVNFKCHELGSDPKELVKVRFTQNLYHTSAGSCWLCPREHARAMPHAYSCVL